MEADYVIGKQGHSVLVTLVLTRQDRDLPFAIRPVNKTARACHGCDSVIKPEALFRKGFSPDLRQWQRICFTMKDSPRGWRPKASSRTPYTPGKRRPQTKTQCLIRQYIPKRKRHDDLSDEDVAGSSRRLTSGPRKCLASRRQINFLRHRPTCCMVSLNPRSLWPLGALIFGVLVGISMALDDFLLKIQLGMDQLRFMNNL